MKDLQELFESLGTKEFKKLADWVDKKSLNPNSVKTIMNYIGEVYCGEMDILEVEISSDEMAKLSESFNIGISLYQNVLNGDMEIKKGRLKLTDGNSCSFKLTQKGINNVENMIRKTPH